MPPKLGGWGSEQAFIRPFIINYLESALVQTPVAPSLGFADLLAKNFGGIIYTWNCVIWWNSSFQGDDDFCFMVMMPDSTSWTSSSYCFKAMPMTAM